MKKFCVIALFVLSGCAHNRYEARHGASLNIGVSVEHLTIKIGAPNLTETHHHKMVLIYHRDDGNGQFCNTVYITDETGRNIVGFKLHGNGCYEGLTVY